MAIDVRHVTKAYGSFTAVKDVSFSVATGELVALLGPSGCGKTTLLRIIAGLETADSGTVLLEGEDATDTSARDRAVGFVFQHYALFRHMTVFENVAFGLACGTGTRRPSDAEISRQGRRSPQARAARLPRHPVSVAALGRSAAARRPGARARRRAARAAARRAVRRARREGPSGAPALASPPPRGDPPDEPLRHARSGRGARARGTAW